jgi:VWFA-related protein
MLCAAEIAGRADPQTLRSGLDLVELDVVVLDADRRPVRDLKQDDFTILEDGRIRPVLGFAAVDLSSESRSPAEVAFESSRGVLTNQPRERGRLVVIVFDRTIPAGPATATAKAIAHAAVDAMGPHDLAAVVRTGGFSNEGKSQNFTADRSLLYAAVDSMFTGLVSPPTMELRGLAAGPIDLRTTGNCVCGTCSLEALERVASAMVSARHFQKTILFLATDVVISDERGMSNQCRGQVKRARDQTLSALDRSNVRLHAIDPAGLEPLTAGVGAVERRFDAVRLGTLARQANLAVLPSYTGGRFIRNTNAPMESARQIFHETASYYLLGFERSNAAAATRRHSLQVRTKRPGLTVLARKAYYGANPVASPETDSLDTTITGLLPLSDLPLTLSVAPVFTPLGEVKTNVVIGFNSAPTDAGHAAAAPSRFELILGVFDLAGKPIFTGRQDFAPPPGPCGVGGCESLSQLALRPGRYEVRVGARDRLSSKRGSVYGYVEVPALRDDAFQASPLQLAVQGRSGALVAPSVRRRFSSTERLAVLTQLQRPIASRSPVAIRVTVAAADSTVVTSGVREIADFSAAGISEVKVDQALSGLSPGSYMLRIEATHNSRVLRREVSFEIR